MRPIKFRAWDKKDSKMRYVIGLDFGRDNHPYIPQRAELVMDDGSHEWVTWPRFALMQYTGLLDKNGTEIYEGDIVKKKDSIGEIYFNQCYFAIRWFLVRQEWSYELQHHHDEVEVIGNIYEHSHLLNNITKTNTDDK